MIFLIRTFEFTNDSAAKQAIRGCSMSAVAESRPEAKEAA